MSTSRTPRRLVPALLAAAALQLAGPGLAHAASHAPRPVPHKTMAHDPAAVLAAATVRLTARQDVDAEAPAAI